MTYVPSRSSQHPVQSTSFITYSYELEHSTLPLCATNSSSPIWDESDSTDLYNYNKNINESISIKHSERASLMAQTVKNLPITWEIWDLFLGWEDPLEEGMAPHSSTLAWRIPVNRGAWQARVHRVARSRT